MKLYLVRHGEAENISENGGRPLSKKGIEEVQKMAKFLAEKKIAIPEIFHSGKLRAQQTAETLANYLESPPPVKVLPGLLPDSPVKPIAVYCNQWLTDVMLVGHLPFMAKLVSEILFDRDDRECIEFKTAAIICLERIEISHWCISWFLSPILLKD